MKPLLIPIFVVIDLLAAVGLFRLIFGDWNNLSRALGHSFKSFWFGWINGDYTGQFTLLLYLGPMVALLAGQAWILNHLR